MRKLKSETVWIACRDSRCVYIINISLNLAFTFQKEHCDNFVSTMIVYIMKYMISASVLVRRRAGHITGIYLLKTVLKHESVPSLIKTLSDGNSR